MRRVLWESALETKTKCRFCPVCDGRACLDELPGMGGVRGNENFILNCKDWSKIPAGSQAASDGAELVRLAPIAGGVENVGWHDEKSFYFDLINASVQGGVPVSIGDGTPDEKFHWAAEAVRTAGVKAAVFIKPYSNSVMLERFEIASDIAEYCGVDIDSFNITTMRGKAVLEKKDAGRLLELKRVFNAHGIPFVIKGIFTRESVELAREVRPDVAYISNHGGRVETDRGSTAEALAAYSRTLLGCAGELWVDGGIRSMRDVKKAQSYGARTVLAGRPFIIALCQNRPFNSVIQ